MTPGPVLVLDAALGGGLAAVVHAGSVWERRVAGPRGVASVLPSLAAEALAEAGVDAAALERVVVTVGPGSFTGVRAALSLARGIGLAGGVPVLGVTVGDAIRAAAQGVRPVWVAVDSKRGRVFLDREAGVASLDLAALPLPDGPVALAGDAAVAVASRLAARGADVQLLAWRSCPAAGIAAAAAGGHGVAALPLYVDGVAATPSTATPSTAS